MLSDVWRQHPAVRAAEQALGATDYDIASARAGYYPYFALSSAYGSNDASSSTVSVVQPVYTGGFVSGQINEAEAQQQTELANLRAAELDVATRVATAYYDVLMFQEQVEAWQFYLERLNSLDRTIEHRITQGLSPSSDSETIRLRVSQAQAGLRASEAQLFVARSALALLIERPVPALHWPSRGYTVTDDDVICYQPQCEFSEHPEVLRELAAINLQQALVKQSKSGMFPRLSLQYSKRVDSAEGDFTPESAVQLVASYQTDSGLRGYRSMQAEQQRLTAAQDRLNAARRRISDTIIRADAERVAAMRQFDAQDIALDAAYRQVDSFMRQFKAGRKSWLELLNAEREASQAALELAGTRRQFWLATTTLFLQSMQWDRLAPATGDQMPSSLENEGQSTRPLNPESVDKIAVKLNLFNLDGSQYEE